MKLSAKEKHTVTLIRELDVRQRDKLLEDIEYQITANRITERVAGRKLRTVDDKKIAKAYGTAPRWKLQSVGPRMIERKPKK